MMTCCTFVHTFDNKYNNNNNNNNNNNGTEWHDDDDDDDRPEYLPLIFSKSVASQTPGASPHDIVTYCFFLSDKLEPYVIVTAVHHIQGMPAACPSLWHDALVGMRHKRLRRIDRC